VRVGDLHHASTVAAIAAGVRHALVEPMPRDWERRGDR